MSGSKAAGSPAKPADAAKPAGKPKPSSQAWRDAGRLLASHRGRLFAGLGLLLVNRAAGFALPAAGKLLLDHVVPGQRADLLPWLGVGLVGAAIVEAASGFALAQLLGVAAQRAISELRKDLHAHLLRLPVRHFDSARGGELANRVLRDAEGVRNLIGSGIVQLVGGTLTALVALAMLFWIDWLVTTLVLGVIGAFGLVLARTFGRLRPVFRERNQLEAELNGRLVQTVGGIRVVKAFAGEDREQARFAIGADRLFGMIRRTMTGVAAVGSAATAAIGLTGALVLGLGGWRLVHGYLSAGDLVAYIALVALVAMPVVQLANIGTQVSEALAGLDRMRELRAVEPEDAADASLPPLGAVQGAVELQQVTFAYEPGRPALADVSLRVPAGSTVALVGPSGAGKTTLVSLVMGFHRPQQGRVLLDGRDLATIRRADLRRHLGVVLQDNVLFDGTVAENIAFARPDATPAEVEAAARLAHCEDFVRALPKGYDTVVGERGVKLSGGQRQRVAIARALLADPRLLILDEATASLDSESEAQVQAALGALRSGRTTFVIAHRLSTIRSADRIVVLDGGRIVEAGTHDELIAAGGLYRRLHDRQAGLEADRFINPGEELSGAHRKPTAG